MPTPFSTEPEPATGISGKTIGIAAGAVLLILLIVAVASLRRPAANPGAELPAAPYAAQLPISAITLSEATNGGGAKATYVDLEPVSAEPLKPGDTRDFRLIFESVPAAWDTRPPTIRLVSLTTR